MKFGLLVIVALIIGAIGSSLLLTDPGYVVINFRGYLIEMSVPVLVGLMAIVFFLAWTILKLFRAPRILGEAAGRYRTGRAGQRLTRGVIEVAEGNFAKGERLLARAADVSEAPLLNYLQAARAAHLHWRTTMREVRQCRAPCRQLPIFGIARSPLLRRTSRNLSGSFVSTTRFPTRLQHQPSNRKKRLPKNPLPSLAACRWPTPH